MVYRPSAVHYRPFADAAHRNYKRKRLRPTLHQINADPPAPKTETPCVLAIGLFGRGPCNNGPSAERSGAPESPTGVARASFAEAPPDKRASSTRISWGFADETSSMTPTGLCGLPYPYRMKIVTGYIWGLWWWRTSRPGISVDDCACTVRSLDGCRDGMSLLKAAGIEDLRNIGIQRGIPRSVPVEVITNERVGHSSSACYVRHLGMGEVPSGALCPIGSGVYVFAPAQCVLQVASIITRRVSKEVDSRFAVVVMAKVSCEMCGQYSLKADDDIAKRPPLLTLGDLASVAISMRHSHGASLLTAAIPWVVENTRSPKETDLCLLLCLPAELGGYGLPKPRSNVDLDVRNVREGFFARWPACNVDLYWGQARLVVEYDSREYHEDIGQTKVEQDSARADALRDLGYTVVSIARNQLYSPPQFREKASEIAAALQMSLPPRTPDFEKANATLRMMLLRHDRWV